MVSESQQYLFEIPAAVVVSLEEGDRLLPSCPADRRQLPNEVVRSALFCAKNRRFPRPIYKKHKIAIVGGGEITYTGEELRQDDEVVWMHLVHLAGKVPLGDPVCFTPYEFLRGLHKTAAKANYEWLHSSLTRMQATAVQFYSARLNEGVSASLITRFKWRDEEGVQLGGKWAVWLESSMRRLFDETTHLKWEQRLQLGEGIASKLMGYWASHTTPYPVNIGTLKDICKAESVDREFKKRLILALDSLVNVGFLQHYAIAENKVSVVRA